MTILLSFALLIGFLDAYNKIKDTRLGKTTGVTESKNLFDYFIGK